MDAEICIGCPGLPARRFAVWLNSWDPDHSARCRNAPVSRQLVVVHLMIVRTP
jgi:hypothetical protein